MAKLMSGTSFRDAVRSLGIKVVETPNWLNRNRNGHGAPLEPNGVMHHHTVTRGTAATVALCRDGHSALPGPLCNGVIAKDGTLYLVGWGRANHAGLGDPGVLKAVIAETALPKPKVATVDGNARYYGFESENMGDGKDPWPAAQVKTMAAVGFVICRHHRWTERSVVGHLEWQPGKVDPRGPGVSMSGIRTATGLLLRPKPKPPAPKPPAPKPMTTEQRLKSLESRVQRLEEGR